ncbi:uncharacterized protein RHO25_005059 [Cercospora beticola]|uniref:Aflatoxin regulatory protein domain-containing protein n=1 Tax=Cercospora beticola TaxID=122368 RepID=A0ABZ0NLT4_CERBT|nr:hypothetical protein RHO25_005059 [Cercospora beticola]CAK1361346.1 unnamed protein product [Cercospora beticola]
MFSGPEDPGNEDIGELHMLQNHSADLSSSFAPIAVMSVAGPEVWTCDAISDLNIMDPDVLFDFNFNHGMELVPPPPMNSPSCGNTGIDSPNRRFADQNEPPAYSIQSHTFDSHDLFTSGVNMLKDLFPTGIPQAQRHLSTVEGCTIPTVSSGDGQRGDGTQTNEPLLSTQSPGAAVLDALLSKCAQLTDIPCLEEVEQQSNGGRRLPRVIASVRRALQEWRDWEQDGFPLD